MSGSASNQDSSTYTVADYNAAQSGQDYNYTKESPDASNTADYKYSGSQASGANEESVQPTGVAAGALSGAAAGGSIGGGYGAAIGAVVGAGISIYGQLKSASDQAELDRKKQQIAEQQAQEIATRELINNTLRGQATFQAQLGVGAEYAASGKEGAGIGTQLEVKRQSDLAQALSDRDASYQERMLLEGGKLQGQLANITEQSSYFSAAGTGVNLGTHFAQPNMGMTGPSQSQGLPPPPEGY